MGLEVQYSDETSSRLGLVDDRVVKLTLCLSLQGIYSSTIRDDVIQSIRVGKSCSSDVLALEVIETIVSFAFGYNIDGSSFGPRIVSSWLGKSKRVGKHISNFQLL